ncbi:hypothetical protein P8C59_008630 [Phyllachora maydis]|uniref:Uncharacterized protein n=1 Tax=Phyllachora maydis TaxID=1825666 RepID=A0AAD9ICK3_9PEZI|nr:hypothetical protein P8C59_008630 [Phyllachora maydis]
MRSIRRIIDIVAKQQAKKSLWRSLRLIISNASIYTNNTSPLANKDKDDAYNKVYKPPTNIEEEGGSKDDSKEEEEKDNSGSNNSTGNSTSNSKDKAGYKLSNSGLRY